MDSRILTLTPWQQMVYKLCWSAAVKDKEAGEELNNLRAERPQEFADAFSVWEKIMLEVMY